MAIKINLGFGNYLTQLNTDELFQIDSDFIDRCVMCREVLDDSTKTLEHIFPQWLQNKFDLWNKKITLPNNSQTPYRQFTVPCCKDCNNGTMSAWEKLIQNATEKGYDEFIKLDEEIIVWWLMKIYYSKMVKELTFKENIKNPNSPMMISEKQLFEYKNIYFYMCELLKGARFKNPKPYELYIFRTHGNNDFDYLDDISRHVVYIQMNDIIIICSFDSFGVFSIQYENELIELSKIEKIHPIQAIELFAKIVYYKSHYKFDSNHEVSIEPDGVKINSEIANIEQIREFDLYELYLLLCDIFKMRGITNEIPSFKEGTMFSTILKSK